MDFYIADSRFWSRGTTGGGTRGGFAFYQLEADGTNQITSFALDTSGNASFNYDLDVAGNASIDYSLLGRGFRSANRGEFHLNSTGTNDVSEIFLGYGDGFTEANIRWGISDRGTSTGKLEFYRGPALGGFSSVMTLDGLNKRVGIGTSSPAHKLDLSDSSTTWAAKILNTNANGQGLLVRSDTTNDDSILGVYGNGSYRMIVKGDGNVGIGTTSPNTKTHISHTTRINDAYGLLLVENTNTTSGNSATNSGINVKNYHGTSQFMQWEDNGLRIGSRITANSGLGNVYFTGGSDSVKMFINGSNGNVGIGTVTPDQLLHLQSTSPFLAISHTNDNGASGILFRRTDNNQNRGTIVYDFANDAMTFRASTNGTGEDMRIDSSGRVLVGKTASNYASEGIELRPTEVLVTKDSGTVLSLRRNTSDGTILSFAKDGSSVGSIGSDVGRIAINSSGNNLFLQVGGSTKMAIDTNGKVYPATHNANDLGFSTSLAWRDLYLSGDAYIGDNLNVGGELTVTKAGNQISLAEFRSTSGYAYINIGGSSGYDSGIIFTENGNANTTANRRYMLGYDESADNFRIYQYYKRDGVTNVSQNRFVINGNGNVGIGTTSPSYALDIERTSGEVAIQLQARDNSSNSSLYFGDNADADVGSLIYNHGSNYMAFTTNASERMRIHSNGDIAFRTASQVENFHFDSSETRLGIGNATPDYTLDLNSGGSTTTARVSGVTNSASQAILRMTGYSVAGTQADIGAINFTNAADTGDAIVSSITAQKEGTQVTAAGELQFKTKPYNGSLSTRMTIQGDGNVGIGTTSPANKLTVNGDIGYTGVIGQGSIYGNTGNSSFATMQLYNPATGFSTFNNQSYGYYFNTGGGTKVTLLNNGNVGIGTTNPARPLHLQTNSSSYGSMRIYRNSTSQGEVSIGFFGKSNSSTNEAWVIGEGGWSNPNDFVIGNENSGAGGNVRLLIERGGNVGIGTTSPNSKLHVIDSQNIAANGFGDGQLSIGGSGYTFGIALDAQAAHIYHNSSSRNIEIGTNEGTDLTIHTNGNVSIADGNLVFAAGHGVDFSANQNSGGMTSELLDDYEEGTFTPTIHAGASNIVLASNNYGKYTKIGNIVHCSGRFQATSLTAGSSSTNVELGGFPFASDTPLGSGTGAIAGSIGYASGFAGEAATMMQIRDGETNAFLYYQNSSLTVSNVKGNDLGNTTTIVFQITYHTT
jgi:hypothetical protein